MMKENTKNTETKNTENTTTTIATEKRGTIFVPVIVRDYDDGYKATESATTNKENGYSVRVRKTKELFTPKCILTAEGEKMVTHAVHFLNLKHIDTLITKETDKKREKVDTLSKADSLEKDEIAKLSAEIAECEEKIARYKADKAYYKRTYKNIPATAEEIDTLSFTLAWVALDGKVTGKVTKDENTNTKVKEITLQGENAFIKAMKDFYTATGESLETPSADVTKKAKDAVLAFLNANLSTIASDHYKAFKFDRITDKWLGDIRARVADTYKWTKKGIVTNSVNESKLLCQALLVAIAERMTGTGKLEK